MQLPIQIAPSTDSQIPVGKIASPGSWGAAFFFRVAGGSSVNRLSQYSTSPAVGVARGDLAQVLDAALGVIGVEPVQVGVPGGANVQETGA